MESSVAVFVMIASFLSSMSTSLAALATSGRIERGVISDMAMAGDDQNAGFSDNGISVFGGASSSSMGRPTFAGRIQNVTVNVGKEAVLACPVNNIGKYKVGWLKAKDQTILALHKRVITHNARIDVDHEEDRIWQLKIRQVQESDRGCYMCQINTEEMKKQIGCIDVLIPPDIADVDTSSDVIVNEGDDATLICRANGHPKPQILWMREDKKEFPVSDATSNSKVVRRYNHTRRNMVPRFRGEVLKMRKIKRGQMGAYLCIASNDVPPAVSKRIILNVNFAPEISVPSQLFGVGPASDVTVSCRVQAYPSAINYWVKDQDENDEMLLDSSKYNISEERTSHYETVMYLTVKRWRKKDEGHFKCISKNSLGTADGRIQTYTFISSDGGDDLEDAEQDDPPPMEKDDTEDSARGRQKGTFKGEAGNFPTSKKNREEKRRPRYRNSNHGRKESRRTAAPVDDGGGGGGGENGGRSEGTFFGNTGSRSSLSTSVEAFRIWLTLPAALVVASQM